MEGMFVNFIGRICLFGNFDFWEILMNICWFFELRRERIGSYRMIIFCFGSRETRGGLLRKENGVEVK